MSAIAQDLRMLHGRASEWPATTLDIGTWRPRSPSQSLQPPSRETRISYAKVDMSYALHAQFKWCGETFFAGAPQVACALSPGRKKTAPKSQTHRRYLPTNPSSLHNLGAPGSPQSTRFSFAPAMRPLRRQLAHHIKPRVQLSQSQEQGLPPASQLHGSTHTSVPVPIRGRGPTGAGAWACVAADHHKPAAACILFSPQGAHVGTYDPTSWAASSSLTTHVD